METDGQLLGVSLKKRLYVIKGSCVISVFNAIFIIQNLCLYIGFYLQESIQVLKRDPKEFFRSYVKKFYVHKTSCINSVAVK
jgi:low affinity Fe/Cu permease